MKKLAIILLVVLLGITMCCCQLTDEQLISMNETTIFDAAVKFGYTGDKEQMKADLNAMYESKKDTGEYESYLDFVNTVATDALNQGFLYTAYTQYTEEISPETADATKLLFELNDKHYVFGSNPLLAELFGATTFFVEVTVSVYAPAVEGSAPASLTYNEQVYSAHSDEATKLPVEYNNALIPVYVFICL